MSKKISSDKMPIGKIITIIVTVGVVAILGLIGYNYISSYLANNSEVSQEEFREAHDFLNKRLDSLQFDVDVIILNLDTLKSDNVVLKNGQKLLLENDQEIIDNVDTLKKGLSLVFQVVTTNTNRNSLREFIKNW